MTEFNIGMVSVQAGICKLFDGKLFIIKYLLLLVTVFLLGIKLNAQPLIASPSITPDVLNVTGETYSYAGITYEWSLGELTLIETLFENQSAANSSITSGVLQPLPLINLSNQFPLYPNNIITVNDDGKNDVWIIGNITTYPDNDVIVVDRMGRTVFQTTNYANDWAGTSSSGTVLPEDTYFYIITLRVNGNVIVKKGFITIIIE